MSIHEPATLMTDYVLAALAGWFAWRLHRRKNADSRAQQWWIRVLALTAASAFIGGNYHGFAPNFPAPLAASWWVLTLWVINLLSAAMALSLLHELVPVARQRLWRVLIGVKFAAFAGAALIHREFVVVILDYGLIMLAWAAAALMLRRPWSRWMLAGIALSIVAALVQQMHWAPSEHFNHNDLYHVIQALGLWGFYRAGLGLSGRTGS